MTENCARSVLRLIAVVTIMIGWSLAAFTLIGFFGASRAMASMMSGIQVQMNGAVSEMGLFAVLAYLAVSGLGFGLFVVSSKLAVKIVE